MADQDDKKKQEKPSGSGRPGTKFMERPKPGQPKDPSKQQQPPQSQIPPSGFEEKEAETEGEDIGGPPQQPPKQKKGPQQQQGKQDPGSN